VRSVSSRTEAAAIATLGTAFAVVYAWTAVRLRSDPSAAVVEGLLPLALSVGIVVIGVQAARGRLVREQFVRRLLAWVVAGAVTFGAAAGWLFGVVGAAGTAVPSVAVTTLNAATLGALVGALLGTYDGRRRAQQRRLDQLNRINNTLRIATQEIVDAEDRSELERRVCERLQNSEPYESAWVGRYEPGQDVLRPDVWAGLPDEYYENVVITVGSDEDRGQGVGGEAIRTGEIQCSQAVRTDPAMEPWRELFAEHGVESVAVVPLVHGEDVYGILSVYADRPNVFDAPERAVLKELGETIGHAITSLRAQEQLRQRERELSNQNQHLEEFASVISHDLRNPLNVAQGYLSMERERNDSQNLRRVATALDRMTELIEDILTLARTGATVREFEDVDLESLARKAWETTETGTATLNIEGPLGTVRGDESRLRELFENLFRNAVEHGSTNRRSETTDAVEHGSTSSRSSSDNADSPTDEPSVTVTVGRLDDGNGFYVADDGPGIPEHERAEVFEAGYSTTEDGTGFGLNIVRSIADAHGWRADVTESETGGARFDFSGVDPERPESDPVTEA